MVTIKAVKKDKLGAKCVIVDQDDCFEDFRYPILALRHPKSNHKSYVKRIELTIESCAFPDFEGSIIDGEMHDSSLFVRGTDSDRDNNIFFIPYLYCNAVAFALYLEYRVINKDLFTVYQDFTV